MKIVILGTRGIPNHYGGFEQCAQYLAVGLVKRGHDVAVFNSDSHPYKKSEWNGVKIIHRKDPENKIGTIGQFIYDLNCILDLRKRNYDIVLQLGYTSSSVWGRLMPKNTIVATNMDGLEWKRSKYSKSVQKFLLYAEKLGVKFSDYLISDSVGIQTYLNDKYKVESTFIPYGADLVEDVNPKTLDSYNLSAFTYDLIIARLEPENNIETILDGFEIARVKRKMIVVGPHTNTFGEYLKEKFKNNLNISFVGGIYDINQLNDLRNFANLYFHGHTVGGTNPSLLEAMASNSYICANKNQFNASVLGDDAVYFEDSINIAEILQEKIDSEVREKFISNNRKKIASVYSWDTITNSYEKHFQEILNNRNFQNQTTAKI